MEQRSAARSSSGGRPQKARSPELDRAAREKWPGEAGTGAAGLNTSSGSSDVEHIEKHSKASLSSPGRRETDRCPCTNICSSLPPGCSKHASKRGCPRRSWHDE